MDSRFTWSGSAEDAQDGELTGQQLEWTVVRKHDSHTHPYLPPTTGAEAAIIAPAPEGFSSTETSLLRVSLTATDSHGLRTTVTKELEPQLVRIRFRTLPLGLDLEVAGHEVQTQADLMAWKGWNFGMRAPDQSDATGKGWVFHSWSDSGSREHDVTAGRPHVYTATFAQRAVHPRGATPIQVALVPAMQLCAAPNRVHGPPLDHPSCSPPVTQSAYVTVGTFDFNRRPAESSGFVRLDSIVGSAATPDDEADVRVKAQLGDVRQFASANDYPGELRLDLSLQVTDRVLGNGGEGATGAATQVYVPMTCVPTPGPEGANCAADTTLDAVMPGLVLEGRRSIWELGKVRVYDGGSDGLAATEPNFLFATQGVFVP